MKQFVAIIKDQINQLKTVPLKEWLLSHLKEDASNLTELFAKQSPAQTNQVLVLTPFFRRTPLYLSILTIFNTYASESLRQELAEKFLEFPESVHEDDPKLDDRLHNMLTEQLDDYHEAWPAIEALQKQGASDLIQLLDNVEEEALIAFTRVTKGSDLSVLAETFLVKSANDLELVDRNRLIQFLRQPDLATWLKGYIEALVNHATNAMSLKLLLYAYSTDFYVHERIAVLRNYLRDYPFSIHLETMRAIGYFYYDKIQKDPLGSFPNSFIFLLRDLLARIDGTAQRELVHGLNQEYLLWVIDLCLKGCTSDDLKLQQACYALLVVYCSESIVANQETLALIKIRLGQPDTYLFETPQLFELAKEIMVAEKDAPEHSFYGLWIQQLLSSPCFVAASSTKVLKQLCDRYRLLTTTLDQYALLMQVEDAYDLQKQGDLLTAEKALETIYSYYSQTFLSLRYDLLLRAIDCAYGPMRDDIANLGPEQRSVLLGWLQHYIPQDPLAQTNLQRKKEVFLYNSIGQKIGFLNESNQAMTFVNGEFVLLEKTGSAAINDPLYDEQGVIMGYLTESGQVRSADLLQKNRCAHVLALVSIKDLEQSLNGLELLIHNVLLEGSLEELYAGKYAVVEDEKRLWLEWRFSSVIGKTEQCLSQVTGNFLANYFSDEAVFSLLVSINRANALSLFHGILNQDKKRELLFSGLFESEFQLFLDQHDAATCLAEYLANYHDKPWFSNGLVRFAAYGKKQKKEDLLNEALTLLSTKANIDEAHRALVDTVLQKLIRSEDSARVIVHEFLDDPPQRSVDDLNDAGIKNIAQHFYKRHLLTALEALNKTSNWGNSSLYRLVLYIFSTQQIHLFPSKELNLPAKQSWQYNELHILAEFVSRHLAKKRSLDSDFTLGHRLLGELIFRSANSGQIALFYNKKMFNLAIARLSFTRAFLEQLVDKFWIPEGIKEHFVNTVSRIRTWFDAQGPLQKELENHQVLMDWRHLINQTWQEINKKKLPIVCAYLLNYAGSKKPLLFLLRDYFNTFQKEPEYLHPIVKLLEQFPQRDVSAVIFDALEAVVIKKPHLLDKTILHYMAHYYAKKITNQELRSPQAELNLLIYFGQNKYYSLVQNGCMKLAKGCDDTLLKKRLLKGANEAQVEVGLSSSVGRFYFGLIKVLIRLWYYGINGKKNASGIVTWCDDSTAHSPRKPAVEQVKTPIVGGKITNYLEFAEKRKQLIKLLATIKHSQVPASLSSRPSQSPQSLFHGVLQTQSPMQETVVAAEQAVVNIEQAVL